MSPLAIKIYGEPTCEDTEFARAYLRERGIPFSEVNIDQNEAANQFVIYVNNGFRSTPTIVFGDDKFKLILTEPKENDLSRALELAGYELAK